MPPKRVRSGFAGLLRSQISIVPRSLLPQEITTGIGMFLWSAKTLANAVREHLPETAPLLEKIAASFGTPKFEEVFRELYPKCENISVDYAVL